MLIVMCQEANVEGNFTNHSLRATGTTALFDAGVRESLVQKWTGHRSLNGLHTYEHVTPSQELAVANILTAAVPKTAMISASAIYPCEDNIDAHDLSICPYDGSIDIHDLNMHPQDLNVNFHHIWSVQR